MKMNARNLLNLLLLKSNRNAEVSIYKESILFLSYMFTIWQYFANFQLPQYSLTIIIALFSFQVFIHSCDLA